MPAATPRIFVNIASYRDSECQWTVKDLFEKAADPDRVFVGICWQFVPGDDDDCFQVETRPEQVRVAEFHAKESRGVCWARRHAQELWQGEEYTLQIDSHMRFVAEWDRVLFEMLDDCPSERAVLSTYPIAYEPPDKLSPDAIVTIYPKHFDTDGLIMFRSVAVAPKDAPAKPAASTFIAAGLLFGPSAIIEEAPYDPHIYFQGEEITLAVRLWTRGWDIFTPNRVVAYHDYTQRPDRIRHWKDDVDWGQLNRKSIRRVLHLLEIDKSTDAEVLEDIDAYSLGTERSLAAFEVASGLGFRDKTINGKKALQPPKPDTPAESRRRQRIFTAIWEQNGWRCDETRSGEGATLAQTETVREELAALFERLDIRILGDAGCGELNWITNITATLRLYMGFDIVPDLVTETRTKLSGRSDHFVETLDMVSETLPECDAILCRDSLTHATPDETRATLKRFKESGSRYLLATTHPKGNNAEINTGGWHPMNLEAKPFGLPKPETLISEKLPRSSKSIGVWPLANLKLN